MNKFLLIYRFNGAPYTFWCVTANRPSAIAAARRIQHRRNVDIPEERTELIAILELDMDWYAGKLVDQGWADFIVAHMRTIRDSMGAPNPDSVDSNNPNRILHQAITA